MSGAKMLLWQVVMAFDSDERHRYNERDIPYVRRKEMAFFLLSPFSSLVSFLRTDWWTLPDFGVTTALHSRLDFTAGAQSSADNGEDDHDGTDHLLYVHV